MLTYIFQKTLWKYKTSKDNFNKIMINSFINKNKTSLLFSLYQKHNEINYAHSYINKLHNLYQSIKLLINITESNKNNIKNYHPILLNKYFYRYFWKNHNKIIVKKNSKNNYGKGNNSKEVKMDNSLSSIKKTIDLDEKDNIQKGCLDFATGNEMIILLKNFQKNPGECLYKNFYKNCNIYKKKKSPQFSFRVFSPKIKTIFGENGIHDNKNLINNNIFINNNNYNNSTNFIINNYKDIKEINEKQNILKNLSNSKKKKNILEHNKCQTQSNILSSRLSYRNKFLLPQSQSCERFIYTKKYISSKTKQRKLINKTVEEQEEENDESDILNRKGHGNIKDKYLPIIDRKSNIKIIENKDKNDNNDDNIKMVKVEKLNYLGRNNYNYNKKNTKNKFPFLLSRITKNIKNNRKTKLTQEQYKTKFNSTFNMSYLSNFKTKEIKIDNSLSKNTYTNTNTNTNINNNDGNNKINKNDDDFNEKNKGKKDCKINNNNCLLNIINKKGRKTIKRKENCLKLKKHNTESNYFNHNNNNSNNIKNDNFLNNKKLVKENKRIKNEITELKPNKTAGIININRFNSPINKRENIIQIGSPKELKFKNKAKKKSYKELLSQKITNDFLKMNQSNINLQSNLPNYNITSKTKKQTLFECKSNTNINYLSKKLFSPTNTKNKGNPKIRHINFINSDNILFSNNYDSNTLVNNFENIGTNYFNTLPNNFIINKNSNVKEKNFSPVKDGKKNLTTTRIESKNNKEMQVRIKVNLNKKTFNESSINNFFYNREKNNNIKSEGSEPDKVFFSTTNILKKKKISLEKNPKKINKNIKIKINNFEKH